MKDQPSMTSLKEYLEKNKAVLLNPVEDQAIEAFESKFSPLPNELKEFYKISNGLIFEEFRILPLFDETDVKATWDSLEKANTFQHSKFKIATEELLEKFLIFAEIGGGQVALYGKEDEKIWFEDSEGYHRTTINLKEFIEGMIEELSE